MLIEYPLGPLGRLKREFLRRRDRIRPVGMLDKIRYGLEERGHYAYCLYHAARLAARLGVPRISVLEFGVAGGNGLVALERISAGLRQDGALPVEVEIYGFDTGQGMPPPDGVEDLPYWFREGQYRMDQTALKARLTEAKLEIGPVRDTVPAFLARGTAAPIGAMLIDVDYFSSTQDCLRIFDSDALVAQFLPRIHLYLDDIIGQEWEMYGPHSGMLKAVADFNARHSDKTIHLNQNLLNHGHLRYRHQIYYAHLLAHPSYSNYIGNESQSRLEEFLRLSSSP